MGIRMQDQIRVSLKSRGNSKLNSEGFFLKRSITTLLFVSFSVSVIEGKQRLLLSDLQHHLTTQHFHNTALREMMTAQLSHTDTQVHTHTNMDTQEHSHTHLTRTHYSCCSVIGQSLQQELLSDLETASELLQSHAQFLIGHALADSVRQRLVNSVPSDETAADDKQKVSKQ